MWKWDAAGRGPVVVVETDREAGKGNRMRKKRMLGGGGREGCV